MVFYALLRLIRSAFSSWMRVFRLTVYFTCVFALFSALAARALYAQVNEAARALGRELADLPELTRNAEIVLINGARLHHARAATKEPVSAVLDRVEAHCNRHLGPVGEALAEARALHPERFARSAPKKGFRNAVIRNDGEKDGVVLCMTDDRATGLLGFADVARRFIETSNLSELGRFRYAYAEREEGGNTLVVTMWTDSDLELGKMFPATGDATGDDSALVPRPPESRRTLSATAEDMPYGVRIYESRQSAANVERFYEGWMKKRSWILAAKDTRREGAAYLSPQGHQVFLTLFEDDGKTHVTLVESGQVGANPVATVVVE